LARGLPRGAAPQGTGRASLQPARLADADQVVSRIRAFVSPARAQRREDGNDEDEKGRHRPDCRRFEGRHVIRKGALVKVGLRQAFYTENTLRAQDCALRVF